MESDGTLPAMAVGELDEQATERLRRIEAVTDTALAHLDTDELLHELLERVRELLHVDTAAVLLVDPKAGDLVATVAIGIEEEVRQGVRIPVGEGFAGRVAAERRAVVIHHVDPTNVRNPLLWARGIESLLGVPLLTEGRAIGVLHVGSLTPREFHTDEVELLQRVADRAALAVDARRARLDRSAATALQRSLIPGRLPVIPGLDLAARYLPAVGDGVGGDWYDVFPLPLGRVGLVIGDVVGRGLDAAVVMGRLRSALRAYALDWPDPAEVLSRLDRKLQHFEAGQMTTVLYAVFEPSFQHVAIASAGHPLPVVKVEGEAPRQLEVAVDPPLGVGLDLTRHSHTVELTSGTTLAFFTDGLVERRHQSIDVGLAELRDSLVGDTAEEACTSVIRRLLGGFDPRDDVALLVARCATLRADVPLDVELPALPASLAQLRAAVRRWIATAELGDDIEFRALLALGEAATNSIEHAYGPAGGTVRVTMGLDHGALVAEVHDRGGWRAARGENRGRGMSIIEECADDVVVDRTDQGTTVTMRFRVGKAEDR